MNNKTIAALAYARERARKNGRDGLVEGFIIHPNGQIRKDGWLISIADDNAVRRFAAERGWQSGKQA